jgi:hypothetical protein
LLLAAGGLASWWLAKDRVETAVAEADDLDPGWRWADLMARRPNPPEAQNAALLMRQVAREIPKGLATPRFDAEGNQKPFLDSAIAAGPANCLLPPEIAREVAGHLGPIQPLLARARRLADLEHGRPPNYDDPDRGPTDANVKAREVSVLLQLDLAYQLQEGNLAPAAQDLRALFGVGRTLGPPATLLGHLVRNSLDHGAVLHLEKGLARADFGEPDLARLQETVAAARRQAPLIDTLRGERASQHENFLAVTEGRLHSEEVRGWKDRWQWRTNHALALEYFTALIEWHKAPTPANRERLDRREAYLQGQVAQVTGTDMLKTLLPALNSLGEGDRRRHAALAGAEVALAAERYRRRHGRWPAALAELVPALLAAVPKDPFGGQPLRLRLTAEGLTVYSIGPNGQDDGGAVADPPEGGRATDVGVRLWNPDRRRRPPVAEAPGERGA